MRKVMERVLNELSDHKAQGDVILSGSKSLKMSAQKGAIAEYKVSSSQILGIRVIKDDRVGISYSEALDEESLKFMIQQALSNAEESAEDEFEKILELKGELTDDADYREQEVDVSVKTQLALDLESKVKERDSRVTAVPYNSFSENEYYSQYQSSSGRYTSFKDKIYSITSSALMEDRGKKASFYDFHSAHVFQDLNANGVIENSLFHATNILQEQTLPTGKYPVVFDMDSLKNLIHCFSNLYSAKAALDKMNPWSEKLGELVASQDISLTDEPAFKEAFRHSVFDSEGARQCDLKLIDKGVLKSFYHNSVTARKFGIKTTAHASRGPASSLGISGTHMVLRGHNLKPMPLRYLEVIQMDGLFSGANRVTGNFSVAVKGYVWERGERVMTFGNCTLSGNLLELLKRLEVTGHEIRSSTDKSFFSVPLIFHDLSIAGEK
jgi:PmbA protein